MDKKDEEAFKIWGSDEDGDNPVLEGPAFETWKAACEHKQREINELTSILDLKKETIVEMQNAYETLQAHDEMLIATVDKLKEENKKLRDALKFYADKNNPNFIVNLDYHDETDCDFHEDTQFTHFGKLARQVLKEVGEE